VHLLLGLVCGALPRYTILNGGPIWVAVRRFPLDLSAGMKLVAPSQEASATARRN